MHTLGASNKEPKLALIPHFCYPSAGFKNGNTQEIETLLHSNISHRADEKSSNQGFSGLSGAFKGATGALLGATLLFSSAACAQETPAVSNDGAQIARVAANSTSAQAQPTPVAANTTTTEQKVRVPMRDVRGANIAGVQLGAAGTSGDAVVVVFYSKDYTADEIRAAFPEAREAIRESIANGDPVTGMLVASGAEMIEIFAHGQMIAGEVPPYDNLRNKTLNAIKDGNAYIKQEKALKAREEHAALDTGATILAAN
ncbi:MAG: hypothetical protein L3J05_06010 [Robiginitomaculum sp.]|nr:hypothetical protein [Robiginitomaculum sp.]